jgi:hypothetical protein
MALSNELAPGLVLHLDPATLEQAGGQTAVHAGLKVQDSHFFLCLAEESGTWRLVPCYSALGPDRLPIEEANKSGHPKWTAGTTYFHPKQVWTANAGAIEAAAKAGGDMSRPGKRNWIDTTKTPNLP